MKTLTRVLAALLTFLMAIGVHPSTADLPSAVAMQPPILAYLKESNVWLHPLPEGPAQQFTQSGRVSSLAWSQSGSWLAYQENEQLWVLQPWTHERKAIAQPVTGYTWSPKADTLAYTTPTGTTLLDLDSGTRQEFAGIAATTWSRDGQELAYVTRELLDGKGSGGEPLHRVTLWRLNRVTGQTYPVFDGGQPSAFDLLPVGWANQDQEILVWPDPQFSASLLADGTALWAIPKQGGAPRVLVERMLIHQDGLTLTDDGQFLVVSEGGDRLTWRGKHITAIDLRNNEKKTLTPEPLAAIQPAVSPDGQHIMYVAGPAPSEQQLDDMAGGRVALELLQQRRLWLSDRNGAHQRQLTHDDSYRDEHPVWSTDGKSIVFVRFDRQGKASLWFTDLVQGDVRQIMTGLSYSPFDRSTSQAAQLFGNYGHISINSFDIAWGTSD
jgi:Tol biopolymer transport system component